VIACNVYLSVCRLHVTTDGMRLLTEAYYLGKYGKVWEPLDVAVQPHTVRTQHWRRMSGSKRPLQDLSLQVCKL